jgi:hypothetical protein
MPGSTFGMPPNSVTLYAVWGSGGGGGGGTVTVSRNGRYAGNGSKQTTLTYANANVIMQVEANVPGGYYHENALIENLIIDGQSQSGTVGILLQNVYNCTIRNLTIKNCDVGIKIENTNNYWSQSNRIEHIKMINVKQGILFTGAINNPGDVGFTIIEDVEIKLKDNYPSGVGIQIGTSTNPVMKPYNSIIRATILLGNDTGCGMRIYGELKYSLVCLAVEGTNNGGTGVDIQNNQNQAVYKNQSFMLTYGSISTSINKSNPSSQHDIFTKQF